MTYALLLSSARRYTCLSALNSDIPTSQSALKQSYRENANGQNNDDKHTTLQSAAIQFPYTTFVYFCITNNKVKPAQIVLGSTQNIPAVCVAVLGHYSIVYYRFLV